MDKHGVFLSHLFPENRPFSLEYPTISWECLIGFTLDTRKRQVAVGIDGVNQLDIFALPGSQTGCDGLL